jgi:hypothetical protein
MNIRIVGGQIAPDHQAVLTVVHGLLERVRHDSRALAGFRSNPQAWLSALGLNEDVRREVLVDLGVPPENCIVTCCTSCLFTDCSLTSNARVG